MHPSSNRAATSYTWCRCMLTELIFLHLTMHSRTSSHAQTYLMIAPVSGFMWTTGSSMGLLFPQKVPVSRQHPK
eukprot:4965444-Amphidinium_carterae.1